MVPWDPLGVPRVPILGPAREMFSKLDGPGPLGSGDHSHTSFSTGEFRAAQRTLGSDVRYNHIDINCVVRSVSKPACFDVASICFLSADDKLIGVWARIQRRTRSSW